MHLNKAIREDVLDQCRVTITASMLVTLYQYRALGRRLQLLVNQFQCPQRQRAAFAARLLDPRIELLGKG